MGVEKIYYRGKEIIYTNFTGCTTEKEILDVLEILGKTCNESSSKVIALTDFTEAFGFEEFMDRLKELGKKVFSIKVEKTAILGITGVRKILYNAYMVFTQDKNSKNFDTKEEALDWLVS